MFFMENKFFKARRIAQGTILIRGTANDNAYLLEGEHYALLIDTMTGAGSLKEFCGGLTKLPLHIVLTHGHADHFGGCFEFGECFIHPLDISILYTDPSVARRLKFIETMNGGPTFVEAKDINPPGPLRTYPVYGGDFFDLGGRRIEVIEVPGHTGGTLVLFDPAARIVFSGDACNTNTLLYLQGSTSVRVYRQSLLNFQKRIGEFDYLWGGHGAEALSPQVINQAVELCDKILTGTDAAADRGSREIDSLVVDYYYARPRVNDQGANIAYRKDWINDAPSFRRPPLNRAFAIAP